MRFTEVPPNEHFVFSGKEYVKVSPGRADRVENNLPTGQSRDFDGTEEVTVMFSHSPWFSTM